MTKRHLLDMLVWLGLVAIATIEFAMSFLSMPAGVRIILMLSAVAMAALVAFGYMRLLTAPQIAKAFAIAGVFWLTILLGLAMTDPLTRAVYAVTQ